MTTLLQHAKSELRSGGMFNLDDAVTFNGEVGVQVMALMETFVAYSGPASEVALVLFDRLAHGLPINPLTGEDDEWEEPETCDQQILRNKRCSQVFKDVDMAWDVRKGRTPITFPYTP